MSGLSTQTKAAPAPAPAAAATPSGAAPSSSGSIPVNLSSKFIELYNNQAFVLQCEDFYDALVQSSGCLRGIILRIVTGKESSLY